MKICPVCKKPADSHDLKSFELTHLNKPLNIVVDLLRGFIVIYMNDSKFTIDIKDNKNNIRLIYF